MERFVTCLPPAPPVHTTTGIGVVKGSNGEGSQDLSVPQHMWSSLPEAHTGTAVSPSCEFHPRGG